MDLGLRGKVAIVTGGSRGLGRQAAISLAREGVRIVVCARGRESLDSTVQHLRESGAEVHGIVADVLQAEDRQHLLESANGAFGQVDILVNNVGGGGGAAALDSSTDVQIEDAFRLNLFAAMSLTRLVLAGMRDRRWGRIISIAFIYGREHGGGLGYMSSKAALIAASKHLALQVAKDGVLVNTVAPGSIRFPGGSWDRFALNQPQSVVEAFVAQNLPMGKFGWPEPIGDVVAFLASERASLITGACINVDGGQSHSLI